LAEGHLSPQLAVHELGHTLNARVLNKLKAEVEALVDAGDLLREKADDVKAERAALSPYQQLATTSIMVEIDGRVEHVTGVNSLGVFQRTELGYDLTWNSAGYLSRFPNQQHPLTMDGGNTPNEDFADMLLNWAFRSFADDPAGAARKAWIQEHMGKLISYATEPFQTDWLAEVAR